jgi:hypothetical protein
MKGMILNIDKINNKYNSLIAINNLRFDDILNLIQLRLLDLVLFSERVYRIK